MSVIEQADAREAEALAALHARAFSDRWSAAFIASLIASPGAVALMAREAGTPSGFILARVAADEAEILTLAVDPASRRRGSGRTLVMAAARRACAGGARTMFLEVETTNDAARALYAGLGFREAGQRRGYYRDAPGMPARDALTLRAELPLGKPGENG